MLKQKEQQVNMTKREKVDDMDNQKSPSSLWFSQARLVINLPHLTHYEDTLAVVGELSRSLKLCYVLTNEDQVLTNAQEKRWPKLELIPLPRDRFPDHAASMLNYLIKGQGVEIVHDLFGHLSKTCERYSHFKRPFIIIHTQRTTNWGWFSRVRPLGYQIDFRYAGQRVKSLCFDTRILHAADHITVMGPGHERDLIDGHGISKHKVSFIPSETDCERFTPPDLLATERENTLLYTGAFVRPKGLDLLFDLFAQLGERDPTLRLSLIGRETPFDRRWFKDRISSHPLKERIQVTHYLPRGELINHYRSAKLYLFPSLFEGSPRSLREAIACGTPAVASDIPGHRGIDPQGDFIHFAPVNDLDSWMRIITQAISEPPDRYRRRMREGIEHLSLHHRPSAVAKRWRETYIKVAQQRGIFP